MNNVNQFLNALDSNITVVFLEKDLQEKLFIFQFLFCERRLLKNPGNHLET